MSESTAAIVAADSSSHSMSLSADPSTPKQSVSRPSESTVEASPDIVRPHFHFRSALTATPFSDSTAQPSPAPPPRPHSKIPLSATSSAFRRTFDDLSMQRRRTKERKSRIQQTFLLLSSCSIVLLCLLLAYYNYLLLAPQLTSLFWAVLFSLLLSRPQQLLLSSLEQLDVKLQGKQSTFASYSIALAAVIIALSRANIIVFVIVTTLLVLIIAVLYGERQHLVSLFLLLFVVFLIAFPLAFFLKTCVDETQEISRRVRAFITNNPQFEHLLRNFTSSSYYASLLAYAQHLGVSAESVHSYLDPAALKDRLATLISSLSDQLSVVLSGALSVLAQLGNTLISMVSFLGFLYFLLDNRSAWLAGLLSLSPFSEDENVRLGNEMRRSVQSIFICSFLIGLLHAVSTFIAFTLVGIDLCLILSFLAGFCSMLPIVSSWLVWLPAIVSLACLNRPLSASTLLLIQLFLCYYLDPIVYGRIKPEQSSLIGMSIVFGIGAFGSTGVVVGPLLTTVTLTLCNIYVEYVTAPLPQHGRPSVGVGGSGGGGSTSGTLTGAVRKAGGGSEADHDTVQLTSAGRLDKQWTGESFPTFFHAAADTPAATLRRGVAPLTTALHTAEGHTQLHAYRPPQQPHTQQPTPIEPPSPLAWQTNPLGQSKPPSAAPSNLTSPVAAQRAQSVPQPSVALSALSESAETGGVESSLPAKPSEKGGKRFLLVTNHAANHAKKQQPALNGHTAHNTQSQSSALTNADATQSHDSSGNTHTAQQPTVDCTTRAIEADQTLATAAASDTAAVPAASAMSSRRPASLRPLRLKEDDDDPSNVPAAVFIHESEDEGPESGFDISADVVDSQRERKQRVIMVPLSTRARKKFNGGGSTDSNQSVK